MKICGVGLIGGVRNEVPNSRGNYVIGIGKVAVGPDRCTALIVGDDIVLHTQIRAGTDRSGSTGANRNRDMAGIICNDVVADYDIVERSIRQLGTDHQACGTWIILNPRRNQCHNVIVEVDTGEATVKSITKRSVIHHVLDVVIIILNMVAS